MKTNHATGICRIHPSDVKGLGSKMKKTVVLSLVVAWLLSGCGISQPLVTETRGITSQSDQVVTESTPTPAETTRATPQAPTPTKAAVTPVPTPTTRQTSATTTLVPAETSKKVTETTTQATENVTAAETAYMITLKRDVLVLMMAYPGYVTGVDLIDHEAFLVMKSGTRILYDDRKKKSFDEKISDADIQDMLETCYPLTEIDALMGTNVDPGRTRVYALLDEIYGASKDAILKKLVTVEFGAERLPFNKEAGAARALTAIAAGAADLVADQPQTEDFLFPTSGTFNYRVIAGTDRLSPHAYGIAIDLKSGADGYWRWASPEAGEKLIKVYPKDLVRLFEKNGFIWGGKWNHFDIFHFEYRPEIIIKARYFPGSPDTAEPWYQGVNADSEPVSGYIIQIDQSLGS